MQRSFPSSWGILVNPCPGLGTPGAPLDLALSVQQMLPSARLPASVSTTTKDFGADFLTAPVLAVYASHPSGHPVEWQDSLPGCQLRLCPGWTFTNKIPSKGFLYSGLIPPFPSFAWRDSLDILKKTLCELSTWAKILRDYELGRPHRPMAARVLYPSKLMPICLSCPVRGDPDRLGRLQQAEKID